MSAHVNEREFQEEVIYLSAEQRKLHIIRIVNWVLLAGTFPWLATLTNYLAPEQTLLEFLSIPGVQGILLTSGLFALNALVVFTILRRSQKSVSAGSVMLVGILSAMTLPEIWIGAQVGNNAILLSITFFVASATIMPYASFVVALLISLFSYFGFGDPSIATPVGTTSMWIVAFIAWMLVSIMEKAIGAAWNETARVRAMLGLVSHEFRTPLGSISGYTDLMQAMTVLSSEQTEFVGNIKKSTLSLVDLTNKILDYALIQSGTLELQPKPIAAQAFLDKIAAEIEKKCARKQLVFHLTKTGLPETVFLDEGRVRQIIINLLENAVQFTEKGWVRLDVTYSYGSLILQVADSGAGIPQESLKQIFEEFSQIQNFATRDHGGIGLGLPIVRHLTCMMGGDIQLESSLGQGSRFTVTLPLSGE